VQHADDGYSRRGNFGSSLVRSVVLMYSPDGTNLRRWFTSREFEGTESFGVGNRKL